MDHKERIASYLSGSDDNKTEWETENALMGDAGFRESFVETVERHLHVAPHGFAASVMKSLPSRPAVIVKGPVLSKKLCAAVCFSSAAAIMALTLSGFDQCILEFVSVQSGKLSDLLVSAQKLDIWGKIK
ncbi:MAG: hypothetical protein FWF88_05520 [Peptococcaceae bacterium]|nr:hypothetical protein [Peptococcaceae bacterium]